MAKQKHDSEQEQATQLSRKIKDSARQIWLAGLGAYTKAEEDAGRFFDKLVKEGEEIEMKTRDAVEKQFKAVEDTVVGVKSKATGTWDKLESVFDQRVSQALHRLNIPTKAELDALSEKVEELSRALEELRKQKDR